MERNTKILIGVAAAGVVAYLVLKSKSKKTSPNQSTTPVYPEYVVSAGLKEGDYFRYKDTTGWQNVYKLEKGKKIPVTSGIDQTQIKVIDPFIGMHLPTGASATAFENYQFIKDSPEEKEFLQRLSGTPKNGDVITTNFGQYNYNGSYWSLEFRRYIVCKDGTYIEFAPTETAGNNGRWLCSNNGDCAKNCMY